MEETSLQPWEKPDPCGFFPGASPFDAWKIRRIPRLRPIDFLGGDRPPTVNLLLPKFFRRTLTGSEERAVFFGLEVALAAGTGFRLITLDRPGEPSLVDEIARRRGIETPATTEFFDASVRHTEDTYRRLVVSPNDFFVATSWGSSRVARFLNAREKSAWILQSPEPDEESSPDERFLAIESLSAFRDFLPVFRSRGLHAEMVSREWIGADRDHSFLEAKPQAAPSVCRAPTESTRPKRTLYVDAAAGKRTVRALGIVDEAIRRGIVFGEEWRIVVSGTGSPGPAPVFCDETRAEEPPGPGFLSEAGFLRTVEVCLSIGGDPATDPVCLEASAGGGVVVAGSGEDRERLLGELRTAVEEPGRRRAEEGRRAPGEAGESVRRVAALAKG